MSPPHFASRQCTQLLLALFISSSLSGCGDGDGDLSTAARTVGLADAPTAAPEVFDIACDLSVKTPCTPARLRDLLGRLLPFAAERPGSVLRLWSIGVDVGHVDLLAEVTVPALPKRKKQIAGATRSFAAETERFFLKALEPFMAAPPTRRTPLFEATTKIGLSVIPGISRRRLYLLTDGLEYSGYANFEAAEIAPAEALAQTLHRERVLTPGTLKDMQVAFIFTDVSRLPSGRGRSSVARMLAITDTWDRLLREGGASDVTFSSGLPVLDAGAGQAVPK